MVLKIKNIYFVSIIILIANFILFKDFIILNRSLIYTDLGQDMWLNIWPNYVFLSDLVKSGQFPIWTFCSGLGTNIFAGSLYRISIVDPFLWIIILLPKEWIGYSFPFVLILKLLFAGIFFCLYLEKYLKLSKFSTIIGSLLYTFSGPMIIRSAWFHYNTEMVFFPLLIISIEKYIQYRQPKYLTLSFLWLSIYHPYHVYVYLVLSSVYSASRLMYFCSNNLNQSFIFFKRITGYIVLGIATGSIVFLPNLFTLLNSPRTTGKIESAKPIAELIFPNLLEIKTLVLRFLSNDALGTMNHFSGCLNYFEAPGMYAGILTILIFPQYINILNKRNKISISILISYSLLYIFVPMFRFLTIGTFRNYYKINSFFVSFIIIYIFSISLNAIIARKHIDIKILNLSLLCIVLIVLYFIYFDNNSIINLNQIYLALSFLGAFWVIFIIFSLTRNILFLKITIFITLFVELTLFSYGPINDRTSLLPEDLLRKYGYMDYSNDAIDYIKKKDGNFFRIDKTYDSVFCCNDSMFQGYKGTDSYQSFNQFSYINFLKRLHLIDNSFEYRVIGGFGKRNYLRSLVGVKYILSKTVEAPFDGYRFIKDFGDVKLFENELFLPIGFVYNSYVSMKLFNNLNDNDKDKILLMSFTANKENDTCSCYQNNQDDVNKLLSDFLYEKEIAMLKKSQLFVENHTDTTLEGNISVNTSGMLFFSIPFDIGWSAKIDEKIVNISQINEGFIGICVDTGVHKVKLFYRQPYLITGAILTIGSILLNIVLVIRNRNREGLGGGDKCPTMFRVA